MSFGRLKIITCYAYHEFYVEEECAAPIYPIRDDTFDVRALTLSLSLSSSHSLSSSAHCATRRGGIYTHAMSRQRAVDTRHSFEEGLNALSFLRLRGRKKEDSDKEREK